MSRGTRIAAAVCLYVHFRAWPSVGRILDRGVARRSFGLVRLDLLLQIDPSAAGPSAGYILRPPTSAHKLPLGPPAPEEPRGYGPCVPSFTPPPEGPMLPQPAPAPQPPRRVGVGIDTSRYGHYAAFLRDDLQPAAPELQFAESAAGYALLRQRLECIAQRHPPAHFVVRLDAAGQYAENLLHFLHRLATPPADPLAPAARLALTISCGDPQRNQNYRAAVFGPQKSDPVAARAAARFALTERPGRDRPLSLPLRTLRQVAGRLQAVVRQRTRLINQFHHLLALTFPELALLVKDMATGWVLEMVHRYPTARLLAPATLTDLAAIAYLPDKHRAPLLDHARTSIASLAEPVVEELVRDQVRQLRDAGARQKRLEKLLVSAYRSLPQDNHLATIPGIGAVTAAIFTAFLGALDRF